MKAVTPQRIQLRRTKGWRKPEGAIIVDRRSRWGNPFRYRHYTGLARYPGARDPGAPWEYEGRISADGMRHDFHHPDGRITVCHVRYMSRAEIVETYRLALLRRPTPAMQSVYPGGSLVRVTVDEVREHLAGRDLACWCPLDQPCHGDVLRAVANGVEP